jgi:hypothetical protein
MSRFVRLLVLALLLTAVAGGCRDQKQGAPATFAPMPKSGPSGSGVPGEAAKPPPPQTQP